MKLRIAALLTTVSVLSWSHTAESADIYGNTNAPKPSVEVNLEALQQLRVQKQAPTSAGSTRVVSPFEIKAKDAYRDAPIVNQAKRVAEPAMDTPIAPPPQPVSQTPPPPAPQVRTTQPAEPITRKLNPVPSTTKMAVPVVTPPSPNQRPRRHAPSFSPPALPYQANQAPKAAPVMKEKADSGKSWWDETTDFVEDTFTFDSEEAASSPPKAPMQAKPTIAKASMAPPPTMPAKLPPPPVEKQAMPMTKETAPVRNAARYDGYELAKEMVDSVEEAEKTAQAPVMPQAQPLPTPTTPNQETLLGEMAAPSVKDTNIVASSHPKLSSQAVAKPMDKMETKPQVPVQKPVAAMQKKEEQSWFGDLKSELNSYFESEEQAQEQAMEEATQPTVAMPEAQPQEPDFSMAVPAEPVISNAAPSIASQQTAPSKLPKLPTGSSERKPISQSIIRKQPAPKPVEAPKPKTVVIKKEPPKPAVVKTEPAPTKAKATVKAEAKDETVKETAPKPVAKAPEKPAPVAPPPKAEAKKVAPKPAPVAKAEPKEVAKPIVKEKKLIIAEKKAMPEPKKEPMKKVVAEAPKAEPKIKKPAEKKPVEKKLIIAEKPAAKVPPPPAAPVIKKAEPQEMLKEVEKKSSEEVVLTRDETKKAAVEKEMQMASLPKQKSMPSTTSASTDTKLTFSSSESELDASAKQKLNGIASELKSSDTRRLTIRAYAPAEKGQEVLAKRLALARGLTVRSYLIDQGVNALRINVQSVGNNDGTKTPDQVVLELKDIGGA